MASAQNDNSTLIEKVELRRRALRAIEGPVVVLETHGGFGKLFDKCYRGAVRGLVIEKRQNAAKALAMQRPHWAVYWGEAEKILRAGAGGFWPFNFVDVDPYGSPFEVIELVCRHLERRSVTFCVNDGLRQKVILGGAWSTEAPEEIVRDLGNDLYPRYLEAAKEKVRRILGRAGRVLHNWTGYYCGHGKNMTHYSFVASRL